MAGKKGAEQSAVQKPVNEKKFQLEELRKQCIQLFGVTSSTFAGATARLAEKEYTIREVKDTIEAWLKKEVK